MPTPQALASLFDRTAARYDLLNGLLSLGRDTAWRRALARPIRRGERVLDLCCGSARSSAAAYERSATPVIGADVSAAMLRRGLDFARARGARVEAVRADAFRLPFADAAFDVVTVAWGLRNLSPEPAALAEIARLLRPGGALFVLDSPSPEPGPVGGLHRLYVRGAVPILGRLSSDPEAYRYLARSVLAFGRRGEVAERIARAGFESIACEPLLLGAAAVWRARRPASGSAPEAGSRPLGATAAAGRGA